MRTAIAFGGHGNNLLTTGKTPDEGISRINDIRELSLRYRRSFDVLACVDFVVGTHFNGITIWDALSHIDPNNRTPSCKNYPTAHRAFFCTLARTCCAHHDAISSSHASSGVHHAKHFM